VDPLANQRNFRSLSMKDLLEARDLFHWHLVNKPNVVGTAIGLYLIRTDEPWPSEKGSSAQHPRAIKEPRTFANSAVRPYSWPCVLVLVRDWIDATRFGEDIDPDHMVPRTIYLPDGRAVPVCVVEVAPVEPAAVGPADVRWPDSYIGGGCPLVAEVQGAEHTASVGCLVSDGHKVYALTNRHVAGEPGSVLKARVRGNLVDIGTSSAKQLTRLPFSDVFPEFPGRRTFLTLDVGLVEVESIDDWTSRPFGLSEEVGDIADLNELNIGLQLIDQPVKAFGAASGLLEGTVKALFYRHKSMAGYDYVSEFLIAPRAGTTQTRPGDSGTVWHLVTTVDAGTDHARKMLRPMAIEWGAQALAGAGDERLNFALATGLSTACQRLDVDLVRDHNSGANPFWGQTGHYSIATAAIEAVSNAKLKALLRANVERISFRPDQLTPEEIHNRLANGHFVELADVPDLVWKKTPNRVRGGRDYAQNAGPEHPTHYADIDEPAADGGPSLREVTLRDIDKMAVEVWRNWYAANGHTDARHQGLLPFRVWQFFDVMVDALKSDPIDIPRFICAAGVVSHYVGDACQPLHGSYRSDGYRDQAPADAKKWPGKGVHSTYEDKMVDRFSPQLLPMIGPAAAAFSGSGQVPRIGDGREAAFATVKLMAYAAETLKPTDLCDEHIRLGGGSSARVVTGLWDAFKEQTAQVMGAGACYLAALWEGAFAKSRVSLPDDADAVPEDELAAIYQDKSFAPSLTLDKIAEEL
jgi:hypothetical protein